jgi:uncharacterized YigZ family protein
MQTLSECFTASLEIKKSTFHAVLVPYIGFEEQLALLREKHPKARHIVWAYRTLNAHGHIVENQTDDGEPKGTSGPPALNALRGAELIEAGVLIVRYFGGIKLGTGGLVRAYAGATNAAIDVATLAPYAPKQSVKFFTPYPQVPKCEHFVEKEGMETVCRAFWEKGATWELALTKEEQDAFEAFAATLGHGGIEWL